MENSAKTMVVSEVKMQKVKGYHLRAVPFFDYFIT